MYILTKEEGGRHTPFFTNYHPQFYFRTTDVTGHIMLPEGTEMVMPGDNTEMVVQLQKPIAMEEGLRFAIREGGRTVGAGRVIKVKKYAPANRNRRWLTQRVRRSGSGSRRTTTRSSTSRRRRSSRPSCARGPGFAGPVPLPTEIHRYCVVRGPHVDKDSREHFEMRIHKRLLDIVEPASKTVESLQRLDLPAGVDIEIKIQGV